MWQTLDDLTADAPAFGIWRREEIDPLTKPVHDSLIYATKASLTERRDVLDLYERGWSVGSISRKMFLTAGCVGRLLRDYGVNTETMLKGEK
jgi:DNA-binding NarL/FixJ family response regulator